MVMLNVKNEERKEKLKNEKNEKNCMQHTTVEEIKQER